MGQRRKAGDSTRLPVNSRIAGLGSSAAMVFEEIGPSSSTPGRVDIPAQCADWIALDLEINRLVSRWSELEALAARQFDYFHLTPPQIQALPMGPEMIAVDAEIQRLSEVREQTLQPLGNLTPGSIKDVTAQLAVAYKILEFEHCDAWPFIRQAWTYLSQACCPGCGAAYAPRSPLA